MRRFAKWLSPTNYVVVEIYLLVARVVIIGGVAFLVLAWFL